MPFHPYLFFGGNCREAFTRYPEIFGGDLQLIRMGDTPDAGDVCLLYTSYAADERSV